MSRSAPYQWICLRSIKPRPPLSRSITTTPALRNEIENEPTTSPPAANPPPETDKKEPRSFSSDPKLVRTFLELSDDTHLARTKSALQDLTTSVQNLSHIPYLPRPSTPITKAIRNKKTDNKEYTYTSDTAHRLLSNLHRTQVKFLQKASKIKSHLEDLETMPYPEREIEQFKRELPLLSRKQKEEAVEYSIDEVESTRVRLEARVQKFLEGVREYRERKRMEEEWKREVADRRRLDREARERGFSKQRERREEQKVQEGWGGGATKVEARKEADLEDEGTHGAPVPKPEFKGKRMSLLDMQRQLEGQVKGEK